MPPLLENSLGQLASYIEVGGYVMPGLAAASILMWFGIGYRFATLRRPGQRSVARLVEDHIGGAGHAKSRGLVERAAAEGVAIWRRRPRHLRRRLDAAFADAETELKKYAHLIRALVIAAPLLGLLGTVDGMVETFDALADKRLISQSGSIAAGISKALFATQLGLAVAIPGLFINGSLERRARAEKRAGPDQEHFVRERAADKGERLMLQRRQENASAETSINVVPMVDVMLVLVIFFVVTTSFVDDMNLDIDRPTAKSATPSETQAIRIFIDSGGDTYLDGEPVQVWMIQTQLALLLEASTSDSVLVVTDDSVPAKRLVEVVDQARLAGAEVGVATRAEAGPG